jgi:hypothetical protein
MSNQVVQLRGFRVPPRIHCPACQNYAWTMPMMQPVVFRNHFHHPSCPIFTPPLRVGAPFIITPGDTLAYMNRVNTKILYLGEDFAQTFGDGAQPKKASYDKAEMNPQFIKDSLEWRAKQADILKQWWAFEAEWKAHYAANASGVGAWFARGTSGAYEEVAKWDVQADKWTDVYESKAGKKPKQMVTSTPTDEEVKKKIGSSDAMTYLKIGLGCVAVGGVVYLTWPLITGAVRAAAAGRQRA